MRKRKINRGDRSMANRILLLVVILSVGLLPTAAQSDVAAIYFPFNRPLDQLSVEEFGNSSRSGVRFAYPVAGEVFVEAGYGKSRLGRASLDRPSARFGRFLDGQGRVKHYDLAMGYNLVSGEQLDRDGALVTSALYLIAGVGTVEHGGEETAALSYGMGYRFAAADSLIFHLSLRDRVLDPGPGFAVQRTHDVELSGVVTFRF